MKSEKSDTVEPGDIFSKLKSRITDIMKVNPLKISTNLPKDWERFRSNFEAYLKESGNENKSDGEKLSLLLKTIGEYGLKLYDEVKITEETKEDFNMVLNQLENYCNKKRNIVSDRCRFNKRVQRRGEPFSEFLKDIQYMAKYCDFGDQEESLLRDRILTGINSHHVQKTLIDCEADYQKAIKVCLMNDISFSGIHKSIISSDIKKENLMVKDGHPGKLLKI